MSVAELAWNITYDYSVAVALRALAFVQGDEAILRRFLSNSAGSPTDVERQLPQPQQLAALLDFLVADEPALQAFSRRVDLPLEVAYEARRILGRASRPTLFKIRRLETSTRSGL